MDKQLRYNFIAHEPGLGHLAGKHFACGGAGFCVAEQTMAINLLLAARRGTTRRVGVLCPRPAQPTPPSPELPTLFFDPPSGSLDALTEELSSQSWLDHFDAILPKKQVLTTHHIPAALVAARLDRPFQTFMHSLWPAVRDRLVPGTSGRRAAHSQEILDSARAVFVATPIEKELLVASAPSRNGGRPLEEAIHVLPVGLNPRLVSIAEHGDLPSLRDEWRRRLIPKAQPCSLVFYTPGRFVPYKNQLAVLRAFLRVGSELPDAQLLMLGPATDGAYLERIRQTLLQAPPALRSRVSIRGAEPIEAAHLAGDVLVHAASFDAWGRVIDEARLFGNPSILNAFPTTAERSGFRCTPMPADLPNDPKTPLRFSYTPNGDSAEPRPLLMDASRPDSISAALYRAGSDPAWRKACQTLNGRSHRDEDRALQWRNLVPRLIDSWNEAERAITGEPAFP